MPGALGRLGAIAVAVVAIAHAAAPRPLAFRAHVLELPGPPAALFPADVDGDGRRDLVLVLAYTEWKQVTEDRVEDAVQITDVVPALFDRRELRVYFQAADGTYAPAAPPLVLPENVIAVTAGPPFAPVVALTDEGVSALRPGSGVLALEPIVAARSALAGTEVFLPRLDFAPDLDGDGTRDLLLPAADGLRAHCTAGTGEPGPAVPVPVAGDERGAGTWAARTVPWPTRVHLDADGIPDLLFQVGWPPRLAALAGTRACRFVPPAVDDRCLGLGEKQAVQDAKEGVARSTRLFWAGDIDGRSGLEAVTALDRRDDSLRSAREPALRLRFHRMNAAGGFAERPYQELELTGYPMSGSPQDFGADEFRDLDGDGRKDLVAVTLDFSVLQVARVMLTKKISIGLDFHVWRQGEDGLFRRVAGNELSEKLKLDLNDVRFDRFGHFGGDFNGDGRIDFVHLDRGREVTVHLGAAGCRYPARPDAVIALRREPQDLALVRMDDFDGDGRTDLAVIHPGESPEPGASAPVQLELHTSGPGGGP
ncbi:MAG: VCBS repeat-containing protein [Acidobacteria bacterium]|nr:VCBS repeat-containing protein [Acidobacteriota bacterium]